MRLIRFAAAALAGFASFGLSAIAEETGGDSSETKEHGPHACVSFATSWEDALKDAKSRNVPIVVHNHGFYCPPCWGLHASLLQDPTYVEFAFENTVEVLALDRLEEGVEKGEERAATFAAKRGSKKVEYLVEFPGLTVEEVVDLNRSKASSYNKEGSLPYTAIVDPFTVEEMRSWKGGGLKTSELVDAVKTARETLAKAHGKSKVRPELKALSEAEKACEMRRTDGNFAGAIDACAAAAKKAEKDGWPAHLTARLEKAREASVAAATEALEKIEAAKASDPVQAKKDLGALLPKLRGTGLEARAKELLARL